jgi:hypothetical protein
LGGRKDGGRPNEHEDKTGYAIKRFIEISGFSVVTMFVGDALQTFHI